MNFTLKIAAAFAVLFGVLMLLTFEYGAREVTQIGFRGTGMEQVTTLKATAAKVSANKLPEGVDPLEAGGEPAGKVYQNVQVLGDVSENEFLGLMNAITAWVSPEQGCAYCHAEGEELSSDTLYTKVVARRMLQMTQDINANWEPHVGATGVNCYTCHRGQNVPAEIWFTDPGRKHAKGLLGNPAGQNGPAEAVGLTSLPADPYTTYLLNKDTSIRVNGNKALPYGNPMNIKQTEGTYALMFHMSEGLGVNCTFCHNSRAFASWEESPPQRATAWHGIQMVRSLNTDYLVPLKDTYPANRLGPLGDAPKAFCATCHQGANKPLLGAPAVKDWPALDRVTGKAPGSTADGSPVLQAPTTVGLASAPAPGGR